MRSQKDRTCPKSDSALPPVAMKVKNVGRGSSGGVGRRKRIPMGKQKFETPGWGDHALHCYGESFL